MKLTDNEIRDINRYLEEGKPLPEKYRFLLFEDKREVELVWNGKTSEVCNAVLPFQVIEQVDEPRAEEAVKLQMDLFDMQTGRQIKGWNNLKSLAYWKNWPTAIPGARGKIHF